jgi:tRNA threonylcarbamoyladenosine biosynthesis protein TsaB
MMPARLSDFSVQAKNLGFTLTLDTALAACTVGLVMDGVLIAGQQELLVRGHAERLVPMVQAVLEVAGNPHITRIVTTLGPGSFTGLRVALAAAQAFGLAWNCPVLGVSTVAAVAFVLKNPEGRKIIISHDAGRGQCYAQVFDANAQPLGDIQAMTADTVQAWALAEHALLSGNATADPQYPSSLAMAAMADAGRASLTLAPVYGTSWTHAA